jgi:hypothetical protein
LRTKCSTPSPAGTVSHRNPIRFWVRNLEAGAFDHEARDLPQDYNNALQDAMRLLERRYWRRDS